VRMGDANGSISFPPSKSRPITLIAASLAFVALGVSLYLFPNGTPFDRHQVQAAAAIVVGLFGLCCVYGLLRVFDRRPGLILDAQGLIDNSGAFSAGRIAWDEISGIHVCSIHDKRILALRVRDPEKHLGRGDLFRQYYQTRRQQLTGSPVNISSNTLNANFSELGRTVADFWRKYGRA